jgi:hypothetical protein
VISINNTIAFQVAKPPPPLVDSGREFDPLHHRAEQHFDPAPPSVYGMGIPPIMAPPPTLPPPAPMLQQQQQSSVSQLLKCIHGYTDMTDSRSSSVVPQSNEEQYIQQQVHSPATIAPSQHEMYPQHSECAQACVRVHRTDTSAQQQHNEYPPQPPTAANNNAFPPYNTAARECRCAR